jgi:hypothetical protein
MCFDYTNTIIDTGAIVTMGNYIVWLGPGVPRHEHLRTQYRCIIERYDQAIH